MSSDPRVQRLEAAAYTFPTDAPERDGTLAWDSTTVVVVHVHGGGAVGLGYTYAPAATAALLRELLAGVLEGASVWAVTDTWRALRRALRNAGQQGLGMRAVSAVDVALWDLKARLLGLSLLDLVGAPRCGVAAYGSGGFTSYDEPRLCRQLAGWVEQGLSAVKMKVGSDPAADPARVTAARAAIGPDAQLLVDANGVYELRRALELAWRFWDDAGVTWFEEPRSSEDLGGLRFLRERCPPAMEIAAGEYADTPATFDGLLRAGAVDCLQADVTRCGGFTGFLQCAGLCTSAALPLSTHTAPALHAHVAGAATTLRHVEWFHDHARLERVFFDGAPVLADGVLVADPTRPGHGLELRAADVAPYLTA